MGYELGFQYDLENQESLCYGEQVVQEIKAIDFNSVTTATVSFILNVSLDKKWAQEDIFQKYTMLGKQLRRVSLEKSDDGWGVIPAQRLK